MGGQSERARQMHTKGDRSDMGRAYIRTEE